MNLTLQTIASPVISEVLAKTDIDGIVLDTEHGCFNNETLLSCIQVITLYKKQCYVRVTYLDRRLVRMCLDAGVTGLIFSTVESEQQGMDIISYCRYPKYGGRRGQGLVRENSWGDAQLQNNEPILIAQLETKTAVDCIDSILKCNFDKYIIGPYDLSASLGCTAEWNNLEYLKYISILNDKIDRSRLGQFVVTSADIKHYKQTNQPKLPFTILGMDVDFIKQGINNILKDGN